jgi:hypothetical protein
MFGFRNFDEENGRPTTSQTKLNARAGLANLPA